MKGEATGTSDLRRALGAARRFVRTRAKRASRKVRLEMSARLGPLPTPEKWVFLVGCYNSGTTLLHDLLAEHSDVGSMPDEGQFLTDQLAVPRDVGLRRLWALEPQVFCLDESSAARIDVDRLKRQWGASFNDATRRVLLEKTPTNAARTRWLQAHFSGAVFIGIIRDGRAVAEGIRRKTGHPLDLTARQWARSNEIMLRDFAYLQRSRLVRYEDLSAEPANIVDDLLRFVDLPPLSICEPGRVWKIHEQEAPIQNMNRRSLESMSADDLRVIDREAGEMLRRLGYT